MSKTKKELAFLQDLYVANDWTKRFTDLADKNLKLEKAEKILYVNAGTGVYALELEEKLDENAEFVVHCETVELLNIMEAKAAAVRSEIVMSDELPDETFDAVIADASLVEPAELQSFLAETAALTEKRFAFFLPTASSFGEVFSYFWQTLAELDWLEKSEAIEFLIKEIPTVSKVEEIAVSLGLKNVKTKTKNELFEFENGADFISSPLIADFLMPAWTAFLSDEEKPEFHAKLIETIDNGREDLSFRFAVKATIVTGEKNA